MPDSTHDERATHLGPYRSALFGFSLLLLGVASCSSSYLPAPKDSGGLDLGWPKGTEPWSETTSPSRVVTRPGNERYLQPVPRAQIPRIPGAETVSMDGFCQTCHETYVKAFANNVHREQGCENCHGPASLHLESQGKEPNTILSFRRPDVGTRAGRLMGPAERSAVCLQCHENGMAGAHLSLSSWSTSAHAHQGIACTDCHRNHYNVPPGTPPIDNSVMLPPGRRSPVMQTSANQAIRFQDPPPKPSGNLSGHLGAGSPEACYRCHADKQSMEQYDHPHQIGVPLDFECTACHNPPPRGLPHQVEGHPREFNCTTCHDVHGALRPETRKELCLTCHAGPHMGQWETSIHNRANVACTDCHNPHPKNGPPMAVHDPGTCYRCHDEKRELQQVAHPHQVCGPNGFLCTTCHDPHGQIRPETRRTLCLNCHDGAPMMAWHSSAHSREGVGCTDCHNPHPKTNVQRVVNIRHTNVPRPKRLPMAVDEPVACYGCHPKIYGMTVLPSRHPIDEGKMVCSDCHDMHGQARGGLKEETINEVCYECHMEKEGPFAYEHAPVTENCAYCHEVHGTVANNLLRQPTTFLCLRCHAGHSTHDASLNCTRCHFVDGDLINVGGGPLDPMAPTTPDMRRALFTDCTQCHSQVHGSDLPSGMACFNRMAR